MPRPKKEQPKRKDGLYEVKITVGKTFKGKLIRKSFYSSVSKDDARKQADTYKIEYAVAKVTGVHIVDTDMAFGKWALKWLELYKKGKVKDNTYKGTFEIPVINHLIPYFGDADLKNIKPIDIQAFFDIKSTSYTLESMRKMRACLYAIFSTAIENDLCTKNPIVKSIKLQSKKDVRTITAYTKEQRERVLEYAKTNDHGLPIIIMLKTGISRSELLGLTWEAVDLDNKIIYIRQGVTEYKDTNTNKWITKAGGLKNQYRDRMIPIDTELSETLENFKKSSLISEFLFPDVNGNAFNPSNWSSRVYDAFMTDMNNTYPVIPKLKAHELRHTYATYLKDEGVDLFTIAKIMGHADLDMLAKRYAHNNIETLRKALKI